MLALKPLRFLLVQLLQTLLLVGDGLLVFLQCQSHQTLLALHFQDLQLAVFDLLLQGLALGAQAGKVLLQLLFGQVQLLLLLLPLRLLALGLGQGFGQLRQLLGDVFMAQLSLLHALQQLGRFGIGTAQLFVRQFVLRLRLLVLLLAVLQLLLQVGQLLLSLRLCGQCAFQCQIQFVDFGLVLQGFGIAVMYLTSLAALKLHPLLPPGAAFTLMVALVGLMALLAVRQNALILAQIALIGGMAAPILTSDGSNNYIVLFGYLALLNTGVAAIAWFKAWRSLNLTGFIGTFIIGAAWGAQAYTPQNFATTEPFLLYHWLLYTLIACLFAHKVLAEKPLNSHLQRIPDNASLSRIGQSIFAYGRHIDLDRKSVV